MLSVVALMARILVDFVFSAVPEQEAWVLHDGSSAGLGTLVEQARGRCLKERCRTYQEQHSSGFACLLLAFHLGAIPAFEAASSVT